MGVGMETAVVTVAEGMKSFRVAAPPGATFSTVPNFTIKLTLSKYSPSGSRHLERGGVRGSGGLP